MLKALAFMTILLAAASACPNTKGCLECDVPADAKAGTCLICENGFPAAPKKDCETSISKKVSNCKIYEKDDKGLVTCDVCDYGYYLNADHSACTKCPTKGCALCDSDGKCDACLAGKKLDVKAQKCDGKCELQNCDVCTYNPSGDVDGCEKCDKKHAINGATLGTCVEFSEGCHITSPTDPKKCQVCEYGYYINDKGTCNSSSSFFAKWWVWLIVIPLLAALGYFAYVKFAQKREERDIYNTV